VRASLAADLQLPASLGLLSRLTALCFTGATPWPQALPPGLRCIGMPSPAASQCSETQRPLCMSSCMGFSALKVVSALKSEQVPTRCRRQLTADRSAPAAADIRQLSTLSALSRLRLCNSREGLEAALPELAACTALADLRLDGNRLEEAELPEAVLARLTLLDLSANRLPEFPSNWESLRACEVLDVSFNRELFNEVGETEFMLEGCARLRMLVWRHDGSQERVPIHLVEDFVSLQQALVRDDGSMARIVCGHKDSVMLQDLMVEVDPCAQLLA